MMTSMVRAVEPNIASRLKSVPTRKPPVYRTTEIQPGVVYERSGVKVIAFDVPHSISPAFGYRIDAQRPIDCSLRRHSLFRDVDSERRGR